MAWTLRPATLADAEQLARAVADGFAAYREFAPAGWQPPSFDHELGLLERGLPQPDVWALLAEDDGRLAGHVAIRSAATAPFSSEEPGLAHFWQLFVDPAWHGSGLALALHDEALKVARQHGYRAIRLFAAAGQARARRFYEREGWAAAGPEFMLEGFGLEVVEYRRELDAQARLTTPRAS
jgi:ribosomal protein S18 acetylase RimI-like enzyme